MMKEYNINQTTLKIMSLYSNDYKKSLHIRQVAREIDIDVKACFLQLAKLEKNGILSSASNGRNKEYSLNLINYTTKQFLGMAEAFTAASFLLNNFVIKKLVTDLSGRINGTVVLFGSYAAGKQVKESDIDLLVIKSDRRSAISIEDESRLLGVEIDLKSTTEKEFLTGLEKSDRLLNEVVLNHVVLKGTDTFCDLMWEYSAGRNRAAPMVQEPKQGNKRNQALGQPRQSIPGKI